MEEKPVELAKGFEGAAGRRGRILVVDDLLTVRLLLRAILTNAGYTVVAEAATGREAVSLYLLFRPEVVLMDITMPGQDGLSAMEEILRHAPAAQIIVCTAMNFKHVALEALRRGACDFITKPFRPEAVLAAVHTATGRSRREKKRDRARDLTARPAVAAATCSGTRMSGDSPLLHLGRTTTTPGKYSWPWR